MLTAALQLTYDCAAPPSTEFDIAIGPMASAAGAPRVCSLRTIKSDVVVGLGSGGNALAEKLDEQEPGWKISAQSDSILRLRVETLLMPSISLLKYWFVLAMPAMSPATVEWFAFSDL